MTFLSPINRAFTIESVSDMATPIFAEKGIGLELLAGVAEIDAERKVVITDAFEEHPYDLLICVPPHRGAQVVIDSGLAPKSGWLPTDRHTLQVKTVAKPAPGQADEDITRFPNVYALGDATDLPLSKAGSTAHFEAPIVAERVAAAVQGREPEGKDAELHRQGHVLLRGRRRQGHAPAVRLRQPAEAAQAEPDVAHRQGRVQQDLLAHRAQGSHLAPSTGRRTRARRPDPTLGPAPGPGTDSTPGARHPGLAAAWRPDAIIWQRLHPHAERLP